MTNPKPVAPIQESPSPTLENRFSHWSTDVLSGMLRSFRPEWSLTEDDVKVIRAAADRLDALYFRDEKPTRQHMVHCPAHPLIASCICDEDDS